MRAVPRTVIARAPTRIDFGGGWTDVPPYPETDGGFVCNVAITRYATVQIRATPATTTARDRGSAIGAQSREDDRLVAAAVGRAGVRGADVVLQSDFPIGAGLGGSSAAGVALQGALALWRGEAPLADRARLAERSRDVEVVDLGVAGGRQDHYAAAFGGALALRFDERVGVQRIALDAKTRVAFERRAVLLYTGRSRISGDTITAVVDAYRARERRVVTSLARMKGLAEQMATALTGGDIDMLAALVGEHWIHQRSLHPAITTERIDEIMDRATHAGGLGGKALGASGGGCVLVIATEESVDAVRDAIAPLGEAISFTIDDAGLTTKSVTDEATVGPGTWA
jgi:D-glycero-alpha-D-manno-heptose-7-phosphate kinase